MLRRSPSRRTPCLTAGLALALATALLTACGGGDSSTGPQPPAAVASVTVTLANPSLPQGQTTQATATLRDASGAVLTNRNVAFSSSNTAVATVTSGGVVTAVAAGTASIIATSETKTGGATLTVTATTSGRATTDRPDAVSGSQVHIMYVLPSDGVDRLLDVNGTLATSVGSWQTWLSGQTAGRRFRLDTSADGSLDISFVRLARSNAAMTGYGAFVRDTIEKDIAALGFAVPNKVYAVYYDGGSTFACGGGAWPPSLPGRVAAMYLQGTPPGAPGCNTNPFATSPNAAPGYLEYSMLHEVLHTLGFVAANAPRQRLGGHVPEPNDLMYSGSLPWGLPNLALDVRHDDYFGDNVPAGTLNLRDSPYLLPATAAFVAVAR